MLVSRSSISPGLTRNPWVFENVGDSSHDVFPAQKIFVKRAVVYGGDADGNVMLLDTDGDDSRLQAGNGRETTGQLDPQPVVEGLVAAQTRTEVLIGHYVRGLFLDDIPEGGKVEK